jgi:hypothetical protein
VRAKSTLFPVGTGFLTDSGDPMMPMTDGRLILLRWDKPGEATEAHLLNPLRRD